MTCALNLMWSRKRTWDRLWSSKLGRVEHTNWAVARDEVGSIVNLAVPHIGGRGSKAVAVHLADPCLSAGLLD